MKKYLLSVALLIAVCISAKAQFTLGIKGGVNFSKIDMPITQCIHQDRLPGRCICTHLAMPFMCSPKLI